MTTSHRLQRTTLVPAAPPLSLTWIILVASSQASSPLLLLHSNRDKAARVILLNSDSVPPLFKTLQWLSAKSLRWPPGAYNPPRPPTPISFLLYLLPQDLGTGCCFFLEVPTDTHKSSCSRLLHCFIVRFSHCSTFVLSVRPTLNPA